MRLFIALDPSTEVREALRTLQAKLAATRADVRWVPPENMHITIKFLGELDDARLTETAAILDRLTHAAAQVPVFPLELEGPDRFPEKGPPRVIIARAISPDLRIIKLHRLIDSALAGIGFPLDTRALVPHLTLGRVSSNHRINKLLRLLEKHAHDFLGTFSVERVVLYQSLLGTETPKNKSPHYQTIGTENAPENKSPRYQIIGRENAPENKSPHYQIIGAGTLSPPESPGRRPQTS